MSTIPFASLVLLAVAFPSPVVLAQQAPMPAASSLAAVQPVAARVATVPPTAGPTLASAMAEVSRNRRMEIRLTDAPPLDVEFVRYDVDRDVLIYRKRSARTLRDTEGEVKPEQIQEVRLYEKSSKGGAVAGGMVLGLVIGAVAGAAAGSSDESALAPGMATAAGGVFGMCLGSFVGFLTGSAVASSEHRGPVVWGQVDR